MPRVIDWNAEARRRAALLADQQQQPQVQRRARRWLRDHGFKEDGTPKNTLKVTEVKPRKATICRWYDHEAKRCDCYKPGGPRYRSTPSG